MNRIIGYFISLLFIISCTSEKKHNDLYFSNNFEGVNGWYYESHVVKESAHSGYYCDYTDSITPYSITFSKLLLEISNKPLKKVDISCWVKSKDEEGKCRLVISIEKDDKPAFWKAIESKDIQISRNEWAELNGSFDLPVVFDSKDQVKVYLWNIGNKKVFVDDFAIQFYN